jgi:hypothetical protein
MIIFTLLSLISLALAGTFGLVVGWAQTSSMEPAPAPAIAAPTATQEPADQPVQPVAETASIGGRVWHDLCAVADDGVPVPPAGCIKAGAEYQANGLLEAGEPVIGGVLIQLGAGSCPASGLASATTDTAGVYAFTGLDAGTYCVSVDALSPQNASLLPGAWTAPTTFMGTTNRVGYTVILLEDGYRAERNFGWDYRLLPVPEPQESPATCTDRAIFVGDVATPDNTYVLPGSPFIKTWRLRNTGTCTWNADYALAFVDGHQMGGPTSVPLSGPVWSGQTVDLSVTLTAPAGYGEHESKWQLQNAGGHRFGTGPDGKGILWVRIVVGFTSSGWRGEYHDNRDVAGNPVLTRNDGADRGSGLRFDWETGAPIVGLPTDGFSVRWTRMVELAGGVYRFYAYGDDGVRVWLDGELIIDQWHEATGLTYTAERMLREGTHVFRVEYYEDGGTARVRFWWELANELLQWHGEYFPNTDLVGRPSLTRNDPANQGSGISFNWENYAPAVELPTDGFSARWTRVLTFDEGLYRFHALVDDGVRLWIDGALVLDAWQEGSARKVMADYRLLAGNHTVRVEYLERTGDALIWVWWEKLE